MSTAATIARWQAPESTLNARFLERYELFLARVYRHVSSRAERAVDVQPLVAKILIETLDDWMGAGNDPARAARILAHANVVIEARRLDASSP